MDYLNLCWQRFHALQKQKDHGGRLLHLPPKTCGMHLSPWAAAAHRCFCSVQPRNLRHDSKGLEKKGFNRDSCAAWALLENDLQMLQLAGVLFTQTEQASGRPIIPALRGGCVLEIYCPDIK